MTEHRTINRTLVSVKLHSQSPRKFLLLKKIHVEKCINFADFNYIEIDSASLKQKQICFEMDRKQSVRQPLWVCISSYGMCTIFRTCGVMTQREI